MTMPKVRTESTSTKKKPYSRSIKSLKELRDLQVNILPSSSEMGDSEKSFNMSVASNQSAEADKHSPTNKDIMTFLESIKKQQCTKSDLSKLERAMSSKIDDVKLHAEKNSKI